MPDCGNENVGVPVRLTESLAWTPERVGETGTVTLAVASVVPSYVLFVAVYVPTTVSVLPVMSAVPDAVVLLE